MANKVSGWLSIAFELGKIRIAIPISLSAFTGFIIQKGSFDGSFLSPFLGVLLLACSAMAFNQVQERDMDSRMRRTSLRPLPSGRVSVNQALLTAGLFFLAGTLLLAFGGGLTAMLLGWMTIVWYNLIYTPLKRKTAFAVIPGSVVGALPPMIGWAAAGGGLSDHRIWLLSAFFFIGQIPHFWLLLLRMGDDYKEAGFPTLNELFTPRQLMRITFWWILWTGITALFLAFFGVMTNLYTGIALSIGAVVIIASFFSLLFPGKKDPQYGMGFMKINFFYLYVMILLWIDGLL